MRTRAIVAVATLAGVLAGTRPAPAQNDQTLLSAFEAVRGRHRILVSGSLPLGPDESDAFWPAYDRYESELSRLDARSAKLLADFVAVQRSIHPATADALIEEHLAVAEARLKALRTHVQDLRDVLPAPKLARYVQLLNKLEISLDYDLAQRIPLLQ